MKKASLRVELNNPTHTTKLRLVVSVLQNMKITAVSQKAVDKAFKFVCGMQMSDVGNVAG